jgi:hypothetical protein
MTRYPTMPKGSAGDEIRCEVAFDPTERAEIERAIDAVCAELGLAADPDERRTRIARGIKSTWRDGRRLPLNLVNAGFDAVGA